MNTMGFVYRHAKRIIIGVIGGTVFLMGLTLLLLPGPGLLVIVLGLAILGTEFIWARHFLKRVKAGASVVGQKLGFAKSRPSPLQPSTPTPPPPSADPQAEAEQDHPG